MIDIKWRPYSVYSTDAEKSFDINKSLTNVEYVNKDSLPNMKSFLDGSLDGIKQL